MGYAAADWQRLEHDIREQHLLQRFSPGQPSPNGRKYIITGPLRGPQGPARQVTTVWIFRPGNDFAELVTMEPVTRQKAD